MEQASRIVGSSQNGIHPKLEAELLRHVAAPLRGPIAPYNRAAFAHFLSVWDGRAPLILDTGCGVGMSSVNLARQYPDHFVLGVDKSLDRLERGKPWAGEVWPENCLLVRADLVDIWRLWAEARLPLARHYLLYPNPWPKVGHLSRRWHGHAVFPMLLGLGGYIECRSNWQLYVEEFAFAVNRLTGLSVRCEPWHPAEPVTPFERKYQESGHDLWRCCLDLGPAPHLASKLSDLL